MRNLIDLINDSFNGCYFDEEITYRESNDNDISGGEKPKCVYEACFYRVAEDRSIIRMKRYSPDDFSESDLDDFIDTFHIFIMRNILFSKPTNKRSNFYKKYKDSIIKPFADHKKEILELKKNKVNE